MVVIVDYQMGNVGSIVNMLKKIGISAVASSDFDKIRNADKLILPGVGSFDGGMANLQRLGMVHLLEEKVLEQKAPILGICLGMQLMTKSSEEGNMAGLGWVKARTLRFKHDNAANLKVPHMGWNTIIPKKNSALLAGMDDEKRFYFVHSYHVHCEEPNDILAVTPYGYDFVSAVEHGNIYCVQFHPEKSHKFGMKLLKNFVGIGAC